MNIESAERQKEKIKQQKQFGILQECLNSLNVSLTMDDSYEDREYSLELMYNELKEYFGD